MPKKAFLPQLPASWPAEAEKIKFELKECSERLFCTNKKWPLWIMGILTLQHIGCNVSISIAIPQQFYLPVTVLVGAAVVVAL